MSVPNAWNQPQGQNNNTPRRPNVTTESRVLNIIKQNQNEQLDSSATTQVSGDGRPTSSQPLTLPEMPSQLSVNAKEFVPRSQNVSSAYNEADFPPLSANAAEFVPQYFNNVEQQNYVPDQLVNSMNSLQVRDGGAGPPSETSGDSSGNPIVDRFNYALYRLNLNPGNMKDYLWPICSLIESGTPEDSHETMNTMVEGLFEQSIVEPNFRYTGARICQFLNSNLKGNAEFSSFYKVFMRRCQQEYVKRNELINGSQEDRSRLMGLAMFMAEIFLNVEIEQADGSLSRPAFLPKTLIDFVHTLLSHPMELEVKCCCQLLKLSGALIEDAAKESPDLCGLFEDIFSQLGALKNRSELPDNTRILVGSVIQLKEQKWNRGTSSPPKKSMFSFAPDQSTYQAQHPLQQEPPVCYTQTGDICSQAESGFPEEECRDFNSYVLNDEEEAAFLEWQAEQQGGLGTDLGGGSFNDTGYDSYHIEEIPDEGGMGEELEAAFEEFLQEQTQTQPTHPSHHHHQQHHQPHNPQGLGFPPVAASQQQVFQQPPHYMYPQGGQVPPEYYGYGQPQQPMMNPAAPQHQPRPNGPPQQQGFPPYGNDRFHFTKR